MMGVSIEEVLMIAFGALIALGALRYIIQHLMYLIPRAHARNQKSFLSYKF